MEIGKLKISTGELTGVVLAVVGLITTISAKAFGVTEGFWNIYTTGFLVTGLTTLGIGLLLTILSIIKSRTSLLNLKCGIDAGQLGIILAVSIIAVIVINALVIPHLPEKPEGDLMKMPQEMRLMVRKNEHNFRVFFSLSIIIAGISISAIPAVKFFKN